MRRGEKEDGLIEHKGLGASSESKRVEWIDTAKGICILLVVLQHISNYVNISYFMEADFLTFRMPLYFILSGLFFKTYEGFKGFAIRKINKLLIPYVFFYIVFGVVIPVTVYHVWGFKIFKYMDYGYIKGLGNVFSERKVCNAVIWFLFCLFQVNILFYLLKKLTDRFLRPTLWLLVFSGLLGLLGMALSLFSINLPYFIDSSFSALPFFAFGYFLKTHTNFLYKERSLKSDVLSCVFILAVFLLIHFFNKGDLSLKTNTFGGLAGIIQAYPYGIFGTVSILLLCKMIGTIPIVSFIGRYSIIVLCTHEYVLRLIGPVISGWMPSKNFFFIVLFILSAIAEIGVIYLFRKYLGYFTAQKDLIKIGGTRHLRNNANKQIQ